MISCPDLRQSVFVALVLLGVGAFLLLITNMIFPAESGIFSLVISYVGLTLVVSSPLVMLVTLMRSLLPGSRAKLERCIH